VSYRDLVAADIRLAILQLLEEDPDYSYNDRILRSLLGRLGHSLSGDRVSTELHWLAEQGCVTVEPAGSLLIARLTSRGEDVALGHTVVPGIARPRP
jgi:hypothetical protein